MHPDLERVPQRILEVARGALIQANHHAVYSDPGLEHWEYASILNAAQAGELFIKAVIAFEHPLLLFKDLFQLDDPLDQELTIEHVINKGKTYTFEHLPKLLWVATGERLADLDSFERLRKARNAVQHFCAAPGVDLRGLALEFLYKNIDPLIYKHFGMCAVEYHEDHVGYDYVVGAVVRNELLFSIPPKFKLHEIRLGECLGRTSRVYRALLRDRLREDDYDPLSFASDAEWNL